MFFTATWPREVPFGATRIPCDKMSRCFFFAMAIGRCETWLPIFCTIPTRPTYVVVCSYIYLFFGDGKCSEQVMIGNRDELKGNQDRDEL